MYLLTYYLNLIIFSLHLFPARLHHLLAAVMAASRVLPTVMKKYVVQRLTTKFRDAVELVTVPCPTESDLGPGQLLVRNRFVGINASDINVSAGRYNPTVKPPFDVGFEGVGEVVAVGRGRKGSRQVR